MILRTIVLLAIFSLPIKAANTDDEIVKNLDFFQNLEFIKEENPFLLPASKKDKKQVLIQNKKEDKNEKN